MADLADDVRYWGWSRPPCHTSRTPGSWPLALHALPCLAAAGDLPVGQISWSFFCVTPGLHGMPALEIACAQTAISRNDSIWFGLSSPACKNISLLFAFNRWLLLRCPAPQEGRIAIVTDVEAGCGGRWWRVDEGAWGGRRSRVVL